LGQQTQIGEQDYSHMALNKHHIAMQKISAIGSKVPWVRSSGYKNLLLGQLKASL